MAQWIYRKIIALILAALQLWMFSTPFVSLPRYDRGDGNGLPAPAPETAPELILPGGPEPEDPPKTEPQTAFPRIDITTPDGTGLLLEKETGYVPAAVRVFDENGLLFTDGDAKFKVRGNSTAQGAKKPYNIKFSEKQDLFGMGKAKKWCLLAECYDPTLLRNLLSRELAVELGLSYTPECTYVELYVDGCYNGLYLLSEAMEVGKDRIGLDLEAGDFLVEYNRDRREEGITYITLTVRGEEHRFELDEPEQPTAAEQEAIAAALQQLLEAAASEDWSDFLAAADAESFAAYYLLNEVLKTTDCPDYSTYFHYRGGIWYAGPVWDYDLCAGNYSPLTHSEYHKDGESWRGLWCNELLFGLLLEHDEFKLLVWELFQEKRAAITALWEDSGWIDRKVTEYRRQLNRNAELWDPSVRYGEIEYPPLATYDENVRALKQWLENRCQWLGTYWGRRMGGEQEHDRD